MEEAGVERGVKTEVELDLKTEVAGGEDVEAQVEMEAT